MTFLQNKVATNTIFVLLKDMAIFHISLALFYTFSDRHNHDYKSKKGYLVSKAIIHFDLLLT